MSTELPKLNARLDEVDSLLELAGEPSPGDEALKALEQARGELAAMEPRRVIFVARAKEKDPDKMIYGPKMVQRVLEFDLQAVTAQRLQHTQRFGGDFGTDAVAGENTDFHGLLQ